MYMENAWLNKYNQNGMSRTNEAFIQQNTTLLYSYRLNKKNKEAVMKTLNYML